MVPPRWGLVSFVLFQYSFHVVKNNDHMVDFVITLDKWAANYNRLITGANIKKQKAIVFQEKN